MTWSQSPAVAAPEAAATAARLWDEASFPPYVTLEPDPGLTSPIILSAPHSGRCYPGDFNSIAPFRRLRRAEDAFVDRLIDGAPAFGASVLAAQFPRCYVDVNRSLGHVNTAMIAGDWPHAIDLDFEPARRGLGLFWQTIGGATEIYDRQLTLREAEARIRLYWQPYRDELERLMRERQERFGRVLLLDVHSMSSDGSIAAEAKAVSRPDFVIGDLEGTSADPRYVDAIAGVLDGLGFRFEMNGYFSGGDVLKTYADASQDRHAIQLEINRDLYMDEVAVEPSDRFGEIRGVMEELFAALCVVL